MADINIDICLPLLKFSHATGQRNGSIAWEHISGDNLFVLLKGSNSRGQPLVLRVIQGTKDLEHLDVGSYIDVAADRRNQNELTGLPSVLEQLPVFAICKESLLAIRYDFHGEARRVQLRLQGATQCQQMVQALGSRGMQYQEQRPNTARPSTAASRPDRTHSAARPSTAQVSSPHFGQERSKNTSPSRRFELGPYDDIPSTVAGRSTHSQKSSDLSRTYDVPPPPMITKGGSFESRTPGPTTAQSYGTRPERYQASQQRTIKPLPFGDTFSAGKQPNQFPNEIFSDRSQTDLEEPAFPSGSIPGLTSSHASHLHSQNYSSGAVENQIPPPWSSDPADPRPVTALSTTSMADILDFQIPPPRELPFKRPASSKSEVAGGNKWPASSSLSLPPLKKSRPAEREVEHVARVETTSVGAKKTSARDKGCPTNIGASSSASTANSVAYGSGTSERHVSSRATIQSTVPKAIPMGELLSNNRAFSIRKEHASIPRVGSLTDAPHEIESPPSTGDPRAEDIRIEVTTASSSMEDQSVDRAYAALKATPQDVSTASLDAYEQQSLEDRKAALDSFMIANLENPAFTTLCEDIENCWRRIALGL